jgi:2-oxoglutarate ferredoxin oxidoreductase subunit alpha
MEKQISESVFNLKQMPKVGKIERGLTEKVENDIQRYQITDTGISPRWIPSKEKKPYLTNSDEHLENGSSTEDSESTIAMANKRLRKLGILAKELPEPTLYGDRNSDLVFVGWGSVKNAVLDAISNFTKIDGLDKNNKINKNRGKVGYLHYEYIYPLKTEVLEKLIAQNKRLVLVENNQTGQLGSYIKENIGYEFSEKLLKYDGRPFFVEDILDFLKN